MKEIKNYEVIINESNARVALVINEEENVLSLLEKKNLEYVVDFKSDKINIYNGKNTVPIIIFNNANKELLRYAYKSNGIPLVIGTLKNEVPHIIYETYVVLR